MQKLVIDLCGFVHETQSESLNALSWIVGDDENNNPLEGESLMYLRVLYETCKCIMLGWEMKLLKC